MFFTKAELTGSLHHLTLKVNGTTVETYIDGTLVDTYTDTSGRLKNGLIGFPHLPRLDHGRDGVL